MTQNQQEKLQEIAKEIRKQVLLMVVNAHASHIASAYSCTDLLVYLYEFVLMINPKKPDDPNRDRLILSKGWGVSSLYSILARKGFFKKELLKSYCQDGSKFIGITTKNDIPGIESTTGSMGHGLPLAVGMAKAGKLLNKKYKVIVLQSDGEMDEGTTWEAALLAAHHKLDNIVAIIDYNKWQSFGRTNKILNLEPIKDKWKAFGWSTVEINGHDFPQMEILLKTPLVRNKPTVIIAHTIKGKGLSIIEDKNEWHYQTPGEKEIKVAHKELY